RQPEDLGARLTHLGVVIAESASLGRASSRAGDQIPVVDERRLSWASGAGIGIENAPPWQPGQVDVAAVRGEKIDFRNTRATKVLRRAIVDRRRKVRRQNHRIET